MNKKKAFIFAMHGLVFSVFLIINRLIDESLYAFLQEKLQLAWAVEVCDLLISAFLYVAIYKFFFSVQKLLAYFVKKDIFYLRGKWFHLHIKHDETGKPLPNGLRPGKTRIKQDMYELRFIAENHKCVLKDDGTIEWIDDERNDTEWNSWSVDWDGKQKLVTCFKASTQVKETEELTERYGIHKLEILAGGKKMKGTFADEYPSKSKGEIYFFRTEKELYNFMKLQEK